MKELLFVKQWQFICDTTKLKHPGDAFPYTFIDGFIEDPLILVNDNGDIKSMSNVCTHRGNILIEEPRNIKRGIMCRYHGRRFNTSGKFTFMPKCEELENFPCKSDNLTQTPVQIWKQFIFSSIKSIIASILSRRA